MLGDYYGPKAMWGFDFWGEIGFVGYGENPGETYEYWATDDVFPVEHTHTPTLALCFEN